MTRGSDLEIEARRIHAGDPELLERAFSGTPRDPGLRFFELLLCENVQGSRWVWVGLADREPVAFGSLVPESNYPAFREQGIPEIQDLNVAPRFRRMGIASRILDAAEELAFRRSELVGIGFGLHPGYGAAQRLYVLRGYVPDGNGVFHAGRHPQEGEQITLDDKHVLYLVKRRPAPDSAEPRARLP